MSMNADASECYYKYVRDGDQYHILRIREDSDEVEILFKDVKLPRVVVLDTVCVLSGFDYNPEVVLVEMLCKRFFQGGITSSEYSTCMQGLRQCL